MSGNMPQLMTANATITVGSIVMSDPNSGNDNMVIPATANAKPVGIAQNGSRQAPIPSVIDSPPIAALQNEELNVFTIGCTCQALAAGTIVAGNDLKSNGTNGGVIACVETTSFGKEWSVGQAVENATSGSWFRMIVAPRQLYN